MLFKYWGKLKKGDRVRVWGVSGGLRTFVVGNMWLNRVFLHSFFRFKKCKQIILGLLSGKKTV